VRLKLVDRYNIQTSCTAQLLRDFDGTLLGYFEDTDKVHIRAMLDANDECWASLFDLRDMSQSQFDTFGHSCFDDALEAAGGFCESSPYYGNAFVHETLGE
jgi:hypothetical protein